MRQTTNAIYFLIAITLCGGMFSFQLRSNAIQTPTDARDTTHAQRTALEVLMTRCNGCHRRQNPAKVFTKENMNALAADVFKQVFVTKRMPRSGARLTDNEYTALMKWIINQTQTH